MRMHTGLRAIENGQSSKDKHKGSISNKVYCYENGNGVLKMINKDSKSKSNGLVYMINE